jgi:hypothetical protein
LQTPHIAPDNGLKIASLFDLAGTKAAVVQQRAEAKDYRDIDAILQDGRIDLSMALACARAIYGPTFNPLITLKALSLGWQSHPLTPGGPKPPCPSGS